MNSEIKGKYYVAYKFPTSNIDRDRGVFQHDVRCFKGKCENFLPTGKCVFRNDEDVLLVVDYNDIIQMHPILTN